MRTWVKATLGGIAVMAVALAALAGIGTYFVLHNMEKRTGGEAEAVQAIAAVKARFPPRPRLVELVDPRRADVRINRPADASAPLVGTTHVLNRKRDTGELTRAEIRCG